jgi:uncharacterized protein (DUF305 family)
MALRHWAAAAVLALTAGTAAALAPPPHAEQQKQVTLAGQAGPSAADVAFAQGMIAHHEQAVRMSNALLAKPDTPERLALIAGFIAKDQQREITEMTAWLTAWNEPGTAHEHGHTDDHGMLPESDLRRLDEAAFPQAGPLFLDQMIEHHRGAIAMSRTLLADPGANPYLRGVAKHVINEQTAENDAMRALL